MRAYTIIIFILAIHAGLAMINVSHITDVYGFNTTIDTSTKGSIVFINNGSYIQVPSSQFFNESATGDSITNKSMISKSDFASGFIEQISGLAEGFGKFIGTFSALIFSIHQLGAPLFGDFNAWVLEGMVDFIFAVALFQMITGRSFKTME